MKKKIAVTFVVVTVVALTARLIYMKTSGAGREREWYARELGYDFAARVDTTRLLYGDVGLGNVQCTITRGDVVMGIEDSLNRKLDAHQSLRFLTGYYK